MNKDSSYCILRIKQETLPWNWNQHNQTLRQQRSRELQETYIKNFYTVLNAVIESGGVVCMDRSALDSEYRITSNVVRVKIPNTAIQKISSLPQLEKFDVDHRVS